MIYNKSEKPFIKVTGSSEMEIVPDEIIFSIVIKEYWEEEYVPGKSWKDYKTKISLEKREKKLMKTLKKIGITNEQIVIADAGSYSWYPYDQNRREYLVSKKFNISFKDFSKLNAILTSVDTKGIKSMGIEKLKNKKITEYREQVKLDALRAAKHKAEKLLSVVDKEVGDIIYIIEGDNNRYYYSNSKLSNSMLQLEDAPSAIKKIKLRYEIEAKFEIK